MHDLSVKIMKMGHVEEDGENRHEGQNDCIVLGEKQENEGAECLLWSNRRLILNWDTEVRWQIDLGSSFPPNWFYWKIWLSEKCKFFAIIYKPIATRLKFIVSTSQGQKRGRISASHILSKGPKLLAVLGQVKGSLSFWLALLLFWCRTGKSFNSQTLKGWKSHLLLLSNSRHGFPHHPCPGNMPYAESQEAKYCCPWRTFLLSTTTRIYNPGCLGLGYWQ